MIGKRLRGFAAFWYDFIIGDDWWVAAGVVFALAITYAVAHLAHVAAWWVVPVALVVILPASLRRQVRRDRH